MESSASPFRLRQRLRGGEGEFGWGVIAGCGCVLLSFPIFFISVLEPNTYGIKQNYLTGHVHHEWQRGGIWLTGPLIRFIKFPATQQTLEFSARSWYRPPIETRTGADPDDPTGGGQPITVSIAIQYEFVPEKLKQVYLEMGGYEHAFERYLLLAGNMVSNTAQDFVPVDFWRRRAVVAQTMLERVNQTLWEDGHVKAVRVQITKVGFAPQFEWAITQVQVAEQQSVVNEYRQQVAKVTQSIAVMKAMNLANIMNISASAEATSKMICANAKRDAFNLKQGMKAKKYSELKHTLRLGGKQLSKYWKAKSAEEQAKSGKLIVGLKGISLRRQTRRKYR